MTREWAAALGRVPLFAGLSQRQLSWIARLAEQVKVHAGSPVVFRTAPGSEFFVILEGTAVVELPTGDQPRLGPGDFFGEMSVIDGQPRSAAVRAETDLVLMMLGRSNFLRLLRKQPSVAIGIMTELAARVRQLEAAMPQS
jgi:CRP/FNR family transcriptional regulator/CRP/FNR family cyclic AMP-dependent transcriptional regulator